MVELLGITLNEFLGMVVVGLVVAAITVIVVYIGRWMSLLNKRWALRFNRAELARVRLFCEDSTALLLFLVQCGLFALGLAGIALMFTQVAIAGDRGTRLAILLWWNIGAAMYVSCVFALGTARRAQHNPEVTISKLQKRIAALEAKIATRESA